MFRSFTFSLLLFLTSAVSAQRVCIDCSPDSLKVLWADVKTPADSLYMFTLNIDNGRIEGGTYIRNEDVAYNLMKIFELNASLQLIDDRPYQQLLAGLNHWQQNEKREAVESMKEAIELFDEQKKIMSDQSILNELRAYFSISGMSEERFEYYTKKLKQYSEEGPVENTGPCYHALGGYYLYHRNDYNLAINNYLKAAEVYKPYTIFGYTNELAAIGQAYYFWGNNERALYYLQLAEPLIQRTKRWDLDILLNKTLSRIESDNGNYDKAIERINAAIRIANSVSVEGDIAICLSEKGGLLLQMKKPDEAVIYLDMAKAIRDSFPFNLATPAGLFLNDLYRYKYYVVKNDFVKAETILTEVVKEAEAESSNVLIQKFRQELILFYNKTGYYEKSSSEAEKFMALQDSLKVTQNSMNIASYENEQIERAKLNEVEEIGNEKARQGNYFTIGLISLFVIALFILNSLRLARKAKRQVEEKNKLVEEKNKQVEAARERAEKSEKFKQQFLANMSHEIRTPMNAVTGMTNLLLDQNPRTDQLNYLSGIKKSSNTLLHIINDILDLSKIEAGKIELEQIDFSIREGIEQVKQTLHYKANEKGIQMITHIDPRVADVVIGDPVRLNQVLMNLAGNAIKFTEKGSVAIEVTPGETGTKFSVIDTGIGIPKDKLQTVFESFTQAYSSDSRKFGGTGLGLTISKQLVDQMGGKMFVESEVDAGSTFTFEINYPTGSVERMQSQKSAEQIEGSILDGLKILLTDDNEHNRIVTRDTLQSKAKVDIAEAVNGKEAIEILAHKDFDIVLMDIQMPVMDGYEATRYIREKFSSPKSQIPIIALTASVIRSDLDKCRQAGMTDYVPKPFKTFQLISAIAKATGREIKFINERNGELKRNSGTNVQRIDLSYLEEFCEGDKARMKKYISMFLESVPVFTEKVNKALRENNFDEIAGQLHGFKIKWMMMGMNDAKELAEWIEQECRKETADRATVKENISQLLSLVQYASNELADPLRA